MMHRERLFGYSRFGEFGIPHNIFIHAQRTAPTAVDGGRPHRGTEIGGMIGAGLVETKSNANRARRRARARARAPLFRLRSIVGGWINTLVSLKINVKFDDDVTIDPHCVPLLCAASTLPPLHFLIESW